MALINTTELKTLLNIESDDAALDVISSYIQGKIESFLCRFLELDSYKETFFCNQNQNLIPLQGLPIKKIKSVTKNGADFTDYKIVSDGIYVQQHVRDGDLFVVAYSGGFEEIPDVIKKAALEQAVFEYKMKENPNVLTIKTTNYSTYYSENSDELLSNVKKSLQRYRNYAIAGI